MKLYIYTITLFLFMGSYKTSKNLVLPKKEDRNKIHAPFTGITLGLHSTNYNFNYQPMLLEIRETGSPWVCLTFKFQQENVRSSNIEIPDLDSPYWQQITKTTQQAKELGFKVALLPIVLLKEAKPQEWRGKIKPKNVDEWFKNYENLLLQIAQMAELEKVDLLFAGSEFSSLQKHETYWKALIQNVRTQYKGLLSYSVNWDALTDITFLEDLDIIGINGYFSLTTLNNPNVKQLVKRWKNIQKKLVQKQQMFNKPLLISEIGYASQNGNNKDPWNYLMSNEVDLQEQLDCFNAFNSVWLNHPALSGVFFYEWFGEGGECDTGYTPRNKPALQAIKKWFINSHN